MQAPPKSDSTAAPNCHLEKTNTSNDIALANMDGSNLAIIKNYFYDSQQRIINRQKELFEIQKNIDLTLNEFDQLSNRSEELKDQINTNNQAIALLTQRLTNDEQLPREQLNPILSELNLKKHLAYHLRVKASEDRVISKGLAKEHSILCQAASITKEQLARLDLEHNLFLKEVSPILQRRLLGWTLLNNLYNSENRAIIVKLPVHCLIDILEELDGIQLDKEHFLENKACFATMLARFSNPEMQIKFLAFLITKTVPCQST